MAFFGKLYREGNVIKQANNPQPIKILFVEQFGFNHFLNNEIFQVLDTFVNTGVNGFRVFGFGPWGFGLGGVFLGFGFRGLGFVFPGFWVFGVGFCACLCLLWDFDFFCLLLLLWVLVLGLDFG